MKNTTTITTLPLQSEIDEFISEFLSSNKDQSFRLEVLVEKAIEEFQIDPASAAIPAPLAHGCSTNKETTLLEQLVHWGCIHLLGDNVIKRTAPNKYQHITGPEAVYKVVRISRKLIGEAVVSVKILKDLNHEPEQIMCELHQWEDSVVEAAIKKVFGKV